MSEEKTFDSRVSVLTVEDQQKVFKRLERLTNEGWDEERARLMAVGLLPESRRKWPPKLRYRLADRTRNKGFKPGTQKFAEVRDQEEQKIRDWLDQWFWRNHKRR